MRKFTLLLFIYGMFLTLSSYHITHAFFFDMSKSTTNVFAAASTFSGSGLANHIVISEVQITATPSANNDFIELYNPTEVAISLANHRLVKRTSSGVTDTDIVVFTANDSIPAHKYLLWANSANSFATSLGADKSSGDNLSVDNSVALRNGAKDTGTIIDALRWGNPTGTPLSEAAAFTPNPGNGQSIERKAQASSTTSTMNGGVDATKGNGYDTDNNANDFVLRTTSQPQNSTSATESFQ